MLAARDLRLGGRDLLERPTHVHRARSAAPGGAPLPRAGDPEEIGPLIAFLASPRNSYMTGADVNVDGGSDFA